MAFLLLILNLALFIPVAIFFVEVLASLWRTRTHVARPPDARPPVVVLMPAHQEEEGIAATVSALRAHLKSADRLLVVADNCTDETAAQARAAGAEVIERHDPARRGKGYALDFGVRYLEAAPPAVVIIVDADCTLRAGAVDQLAARAAASGRPVQGLYLMTAPPDGGLNFQVAEFAFLVKNRARAAGLHALGLPCHLSGSGMAFPWAIIRDAHLAHASLVEDMKLGLDLALNGTPPLYCEEARIDSFFPYTTAAAASQRSRWEEGHLGMIAMALRQMPRALATRNMGALALALDIMVPPLTLLLMLVVGAAMLTAALTWMLGVPAPALWLALINLLLIGLAVVVAWYAYGRQALPVGSLLRIVPYVLSKLKLYSAMAGGARNASWVRTDRKKSES